MGYYLLFDFYILFVIYRTQYLVITMQIIDIDPRDCTRWKFADRSSFEFGDTNLLAEDIKRNGQIEPVFVRELKNSKFKYEVIAGSRRLQACLNANLPLKAIITDISDIKAAITQIKENENLAISDYSKGISYVKLQKELNLSRCYCQLRQGKKK